MDLTASDFLAGSLLSWALPLALLIAVLVWWLLALRRRSSDES
jgi:cytochrome c-type biogenesis protein CcmH/NrfF